MRRAVPVLFFLVYHFIKLQFWWLNCHAHTKEIPWVVKTMLLNEGRSVSLILLSKTIRAEDHPATKSI